jgi:hypothetical protein
MRNSVPGRSRQQPVGRARSEAAIRGCRLFWIPPPARPHRARHLRAAGRTPAADVSAAAQASQVHEAYGQREMRYLLGCGALQEVFGLTPA